MSQPQHTHTLRQEIGFGAQLAMSALGEPHEIQPENNGGAVLKARMTSNPLASLRATSEWNSFPIFNGIPNTIPAGIRQIAIEVESISNPDAPAPQVFHLPGFFRGAEQARYYGVDQLTVTAPLVKGPIPNHPVAPDKLCYWWDFTDPTQVFEDVAGLIPAVDGGDISYIGDKGRAGFSIAQNPSQNPTYNTAFVNGLNVAENAIAGFPIQEIDWGGGLDGTVAGITVSCAVRAEFLGSVQNFWSMGPAVGNLFVLGLDGPGSGEWEMYWGAVGNSIESGKLGVIGEWVWMYGTIDPAGNTAFRVAGGSEVAGPTSPVPNVPAGSNTSITGIKGFHGEYHIWDFEFGASDKIDLIAYYDGKYGVMPF